MLGPQERSRLLEQLRPPAGYRLDRVVGTTYSLDLVSLLIAPLAMSLFECEDKDEALSDPAAILEGLRRTVDNMAIFCQSSRVVVPKADNYLLSFLEPVVVEVEPRDAEGQATNGVFHPKVWVLRFINETKEISYRLINLSRNMTFDRSWDTMLVLDGAYDMQRTNAFAENRPLCEFIAALPALGQNASPKIRKLVGLVADEVLRVKWEKPSPFESLSFHPIGIPGWKRAPKIESQERMLMVSPFLSDEIVARLETGKKNVLISRAESLDALGATFLQRLQRTTQIYVMDPGAEKSTEETDAELLTGEPMEDLSGLHAKLYVTEAGWNATYYTGSANATNAAFQGVNVEFLVAMEGKKSTLGLSKILGEEGDVSLSNVLLPYVISQAPLPTDAVGKALDDKLEKARRILARLDLRVAISTQADDGFSARLSVKKSKEELPADILVNCRPALLPPAASKKLAMEGAVFAPITLLALTSFWAFELTATQGDRTLSVSFARNLPTEGLPAVRNARILRHIIGNQERFVQYLLLLLADDAEGLQRELKRQKKPMGGGLGPQIANVPLLEELVRAYSRHPEKIRRISELVTDLKKGSDGGQSILPAGFEDVWPAFQTVITGVKK